MAGTGRFTAKQERCIKKVKAKGHDKVSAIKICQSRIKKKDIMGAKNRKKTKNKNKRQNKKRRQAYLKELALLKEARDEELAADEDDQIEELIEDLTEELEGDEEEVTEEPDEEETEAIADIIENLSEEDAEKIIEGAAEALAEEEVEEKKPASEIVEEVAPEVVQEEETPEKETEESEDEEKSYSPKEALGILIKSLLPKVKPSEKYASSFVITKDKNGDDRWIGKVTNRWSDREGDILTNASHKEFVGFLDKNPYMAPSFLPWHNIKSAFTFPTDSWEYKNGHMVYSGKLTTEEAQSLKEVSKNTRLGMSHGFFALKREMLNKKNITKYRTFEVSVLPLHNAANPYTELEVIAKEANMERKEFLTDLLTPDQYKKFAQELEENENLLDNSGVKTKEVADPQEDAVIEQIAKALGMDELSESFKGFVEEMKVGREERKAMGIVIKAMAEKLDISEEAQEEQLAKMIEAPAGKYPWQNRATNSKENLVDEKKDESLVKGAPKLDSANEHWLGASTHTTSIKPTKQEVAEYGA